MVKSDQKFVKNGGFYQLRFKAYIFVLQYFTHWIFEFEKKYAPALQIIQMVIQNIFGTQNIMKSDGATLIHVKGYPDILTCLQTNSESTIVNFIIQLTTLPPIRIDVCPLIFNIFFDPKNVWKSYFYDL